MKPSEEIYQNLQSDAGWHDSHLSEDEKMRMIIDAVIYYLDEKYEEWGNE